MWEGAVRQEARRGDQGTAFGEKMTPNGWHIMDPRCGLDRGAPLQVSGATFRTPGKGNMQSGRWWVVLGKTPWPAGSGTSLICQVLPAVVREERARKDLSSLGGFSLVQAQGHAALAGQGETSNQTPDFQPHVTSPLCLDFIYFLVFTKHNLLGPEQLGFSNPEGMSKAAAPEREFSEVQYANSHIFHVPEGSQNHNSQ